MNKKPGIYSPGENGKIVSEIAFECFGGYEKMFVFHGWPERGSDMLRAVQKRIRETYGSIQEFDTIYRKRGSETKKEEEEIDDVRGVDFLIFDDKVVLFERVWWKPKAMSVTKWLWMWENVKLLVEGNHVLKNLDEAE
jgi:hypothetical protein